MHVSGASIISPHYPSLVSLDSVHKIRLMQHHFISFHSMHTYIVITILRTYVNVHKSQELIIYYGIHMD